MLPVYIKQPDILPDTRTRRHENYTRKGFTKANIDGQ